jgi:hypothetical protein
MGYALSGISLNTGDNAADGQITYITATTLNLGNNRAHVNNVEISPASVLANTMRSDGKSFVPAVFASSGLMSIHTSIPYIGRKQDGSQPDYFNGTIPEVIVFGTGSTATERNKIETYLAVKYGITLDQVTPQNYVDTSGVTIWDATVNAVHNKNITGIGRDDIEELDQKQSKSINAGGLVTIGKSAIVATNALNTGTFAANRDYLVFGDNNGSLAYSAVGSPAHMTVLTRTWKVQETGTDSTDYTLSVPDNTSPLAVRLPSDFGYPVLLLQDADGNFASGAISTRMNLIGTNWELPNVDLDNGQFFTFGYGIPGFTMVTTDNLTGEDGATGAFTIVMKMKPTANVTVALSSSNAAKCYFYSYKLEHTANYNGEWY